MSEYKYVAEEIQQIDQLLAENYLFKSIKEDLEGAFVTFINIENNEERILHIKMADTRKYFSSKLHEQLNS
ncbi:MAG: hypothetical protein ABS944_15775 [Solibacillus sp.]|jgi:hypothetical protein|uniref:hypothetical protein n=1 Tax=unclassified Solibacillus TaxID=2637870 RepID=UPI0030FB9E99